MQALWMVIASLLFSVMGVCIKLAGDLYHTGEIAFYRGLIGLITLLWLTRLTGQSLRTGVPGKHLKRGLIGVASLLLWFQSIQMLPLAAAVTLNYTSSVWIAVILAIGAWMSRGQRMDRRLAAAICLSFFGVLCVMQPGLGASHLIGSAIGLASGVLSAFAYLQVRALGIAGEPEARIVFYFSLTSAVIGLAWMLIAGTHEHTPRGLLLLLGTGLSATAAQVAMTRAYRHGSTLVVANLQYLGIVFASGWSLLLWSDHLNLAGWAGIMIIIASGVATTLLRARPDPVGSEASEAVIASPHGNDEDRPKDYRAR